MEQYYTGRRWSFLNKFGVKETRLVPKPSHDDFCTMVYRYLLERELVEHCKSICEGCSYNSLGQTSHLQGCLLPWSFVVSEYLCVVLQKVSELELMKAYSQVLGQLQQPKCVSYELAHRVISSNPPGVIQKSLKAADMPFVYKELFVEAIGTCSDMPGPPPCLCCRVPRPHPPPTR